MPRKACRYLFKKPGEEERSMCVLPFNHKPATEHKDQLMLDEEAEALNLQALEEDARCASCGATVADSKLRRAGTDSMSWLCVVPGPCVERREKLLEAQERATFNEAERVAREDACAICEAPRSLGGLTEGLCPVCVHETHKVLPFIRHWLRNNLKVSVDCDRDDSMLVKVTVKLGDIEVSSQDYVQLPRRD